MKNSQKLDPNKTFKVNHNLNPLSITNFDINETTPSDYQSRNDMVQLKTVVSGPLMDFNACYTHYIYSPNV